MTPHVRGMEQAETFRRIAADAGMSEGMRPMDEMLRQSDQFGPRVEVPDDADPATKLIAFTGPTP